MRKHLYIGNTVRKIYYISKFTLMQNVDANILKGIKVQTHEICTTKNQYPLITTNNQL